MRDMIKINPETGDKLKLTLEWDGYEYVVIDAGPVTVSNPKNWPPIEGDIWTFDGKEFVCVTMDGVAQVTYLLSSSGKDGIFYKKDYDLLLKKHPKLLRRRSKVWTS
jgi:hypothetical protein